MVPDILFFRLMSGVETVCTDIGWDTNKIPGSDPFVVVHSEGFCFRIYCMSDCFARFLLLVKLWMHLLSYGNGWMHGWMDG